MSHRFSLPTEAEIENLIMQVYEFMPNPDQSRLSLIENKVLLKARRNKPKNKLNKTPWWIVLLLVGGFATAAWWVGELFVDWLGVGNTATQLHSDDNIIEIQSGINEVESDIESSDQRTKNDKTKNSPIIYQRESSY